MIEYEGKTYCPRRQESVGFGSNTRFKIPASDHWRKDGTCSWCGSLSPSLFFQAIDDGCEIGPTDKAYKVYVNGDKAPNVHGACKFYFQHLTPDDQQKFVDLYNDGKMKIGYPGHFYVRPFFCGRREGG